tara:strand:- start:4647 stop:5042 length:396 start_codon:yes stop_codon:yes gene_type:complete
MKITLSGDSDIAERDQLDMVITNFMNAYEKRIVITIGFEGPIVNVSRQTIVDLVARLVGIKSENVRKVKGCLITPRGMTSNETSLATLFTTLYSTRCAFLVTDNVTAQNVFVHKLIEREKRKRMKRESSST